MYRLKRVILYLTKTKNLHLFHSHFPSLTKHSYKSSFSKPSKWFYNNIFKLTLHRHRHSKPSLPTPPMSPHSSTSRQADDFREVFHSFNANGDGKISSDERRSFFASAGEDMTLEEEEREAQWRGGGFEEGVCDDPYGRVFSPTSTIHWEDLGYLYRTKEPK